MAKVILTRDFQYDMPGDCRLFAAGERELAEPYLSAAMAAGLVADPASPVTGAAPAQPPRRARKPRAPKAGG
jgi:hypothetical protein